jgi:hypothetical protein
MLDICNIASRMLDIGHTSSESDTGARASASPRRRFFSTV